LTLLQSNPRKARIAKASATRNSQSPLSIASMVSLDTSLRRTIVLRGKAPCGKHLTHHRSAGQLGGEGGSGYTEDSASRGVVCLCAPRWAFRHCSR
jgi:hypothetical protein